MMKKLKLLSIDNLDVANQGNKGRLLFKVMEEIDSIIVDRW